MSVVKFTETVFAENGKKGVLTPDEDGYYTVMVGALNSYNSAGEFYTAEGAIELFNTSAQLMRRIKNKALYSELGHPKRQPGMSLNDFYYRVISIEETNICGHFSEISLDLDWGKKNPQLRAPDMIAITAKVKPAGAKANALQLALENPKQNAAFSVRGLTENKNVNGRTERRLTNIITFDFVTEPGIRIADKHFSPALESINSRAYELTDTLVDKETLRKVLSESMNHIGMESNRGMYEEILNSIKPPVRKGRLSQW